MRTPLRQQLLDHTLSFVAALRSLVERIARHDRDLAQQAHNAANSVGLNVAEGLAVAWSRAFGSARRIAAAVRRMTDG